MSLAQLEDAAATALGMVELLGAAAVLQSSRDLSRCCDQ